MFRIKIGFSGFLFLLLAIVCGLQAANAAMPHLINYQGRLTDSGGAPLNGSYAITFRRQRIASSAYALRAENADQANQAKNADSVGNVGVSATATANKLLPLDTNAKLPVSALKTYDSGWFAVAMNTNYVKTHNLGTTKVIANVMFSMNSDGSCPTMFHMGVSETGNPRQASMMNLTTATITITIPATGMAAFVDTNGVSHDLTSGYCRITMLALE